MTLDRYELRVLTPEGSELARIPDTAFERIVYDRALNAVGSLTLQFVNHADYADAFVRYAILDLWRQRGGTGNFEREDTYLYRRRTVKAENDRVTLVVRGDHLNTILAGREIAAAADEDVEVTGHAGDVMKDLVSAWVGPGAPTHQRVDDLFVDARHGEGLIDTVKARRQKLMTVLKRLADASGVDFHITHTGGGALLFRTGRPYGADKTYETNRYTSSPYILFDINRGNARQITIDTLEADVDQVYAAGRGADDERQVLRVDGPDYRATRFNCRDASADARAADDQDALRAAALSALARGDRSRRIQLALPADDAASYGNTWDLGDWVSVRDPVTGEIYDLSVTKITVTLDRKGQLIVPFFKDI